MHQATTHTKYWPSSMMPHGIPRPQWVDFQRSSQVSAIYSCGTFSWKNFVDDDHFNLWENWKYIQTFEKIYCNVLQKNMFRYLLSSFLLNSFYDMILYHTIYFQIWQENMNNALNFELTFTFHVLPLSTSHMAMLLSLQGKLYVFYQTLICITPKRILWTQKLYYMANTLVIYHINILNVGL